MCSQRFVHNVATRRTPLSCGWDVSTPEHDPTFLNRLCTAYSQAMSPPTASPSSKEGIWKHLIEGHRDVHEWLVSRQIEPLDEYLGHMHDTPMTEGFAQGAEEAERIKHDIGYATRAALIQFDRLLSIAEYLAVIPLENPEQGSFQQFLDADPDLLLNNIASRLGIDLAMPRWQGGLWGIRTRRGILSDRDPMALYAAIRISEICPDRQTPICEIGGGAGYLAFYLSQFGYSDITIIDFPTINTAQGYWLRANLGAAEVQLHGESVSSRVAILGTSEFGRRKFGLIVNTDSFPEMSDVTCLDYLTKIAKLSPLLFSINQEAYNVRAYRDIVNPGDIQTPVGVTARRVPNLQRVYRARYWLRKGYVEEIYRTHEYSM